MKLYQEIDELKLELNEKQEELDKLILDQDKEYYLKLRQKYINTNYKVKLRRSFGRLSKRDREYNHNLFVRIKRMIDEYDEFFNLKDMLGKYDTKFDYNHWQ